MQYKGLSRVFSNTTVQNHQFFGAQLSLWSSSTFKVRRGSGEEIPLIQGKEQQLRFAGAAVKR